MGQPQFSQIVATASRESIVFSDLTSSVNVIAGGSETIDIYAPAGTICELLFLRVKFLPPVGASSGWHSFGLTNSAGYGSYLSGQSNFGSNVDFGNYEWIMADLSKYPTNNVGFNVTAVKFDSTIGVRLIYTNNTNANTNAGIKTYLIQYLKRSVG